MTVTFQSVFLGVAETLFQEAFTREEDPVTTSQTGSMLHFHFPDDTLIRDVRSWCADAFGCGLISMSAITVNY